MKNKRNLTGKIVMWVFLLSIVGAILAGFYVYYPNIETYINSQTVEPIVEIQKDTTKDFRFEQWLEQEKEQLLNTPEFKKKIDAELEREILRKHRKEVEERMLQLEDGGFTGEKVSRVRKFLTEYNPEMSKYAEDIIQLPRWVEVLALAGHETRFCTTGVGKSKNNCGAIKSTQNAGFKVYANQMEAMEDISLLLQKDLYKDKSVSQMNGVYCVYEEGSTGTGPCPGWEESVRSYIGKIQLARS